MEYFYYERNDIEMKEPRQLGHLIQPLSANTLVNVVYSHPEAMIMTHCYTKE